MQEEKSIQFRGRAQAFRSALGTGIRVTDEDHQRASELTGAHASLAAHALALATPGLAANELALQLRLASPEGAELSEPLIEQLLEAQLLSEVVPAAQRVEAHGDPALSAVLRSALSDRYVRSDSPPLQVVALGHLGSAEWHARLKQARTRPERTLTISLDPSGAFVMPLRATHDSPCPECLWARRRAVLPAEFEPGSSTLIAQLLPVIACHALGIVEQLGRDRWPDKQVLHVETSDVHIRRLLPQPGCPGCAAPRHFARGLPVLAAEFERTTALALTLQDADEPSEDETSTFLDPFLGPLQIERYQGHGLFRDLPLVVGSLRMMQPGASGLRRLQLFSITFGSGNTETRRQLIAFAEGIERYAGLMEQPDIRDRRASELGEVAVPPNEVLRFLDEQYRSPEASFARYDDQAIDWSFAHEWVHGGQRLLPHDALCIRPARAPGAFRLFDELFSSGFAAHRTLPLALERALYELIERDAFLLAWYLRLPLNELVFSSADPAAREMFDYLKAHELELRFFDLRVDFDVPCVLTLARSLRDRGPWRAGGHVLLATAGPTFDDCFKHCLQELVGHFSVFGVISPHGDKQSEPGTKEERPWWAMFARYLSPRADAPFAFLDGRVPSPAPTGEAALTLGDLRQRFAARSLSVFVRALGAGDARRSGLVPMRALVPGLLRLSPSRETVNFAEPRLESVRRVWAAPAELNPLPHPLA